MRPRRPFSPLALPMLIPLAAAAEPPRRVVVEGLGRLPAFSHATVVGDLGLAFDARVEIECIAARSK